MTAPAEQILWRGHPSHITSFGIYLVCILVAAGLIAGAFIWNPLVAAGAALPLLVMLVRWVQVRSQIYEVTTERIKMWNGVLSKRMEELELYRVRDTVLEQPFLYRMFGKGNVIMATNDTTTPQITLRCIPNAEGLREQLRQAIEACRVRKGVRYAELGGEVDTE